MKTVAIIGGGIAGLTAGIFAQKNGFASIILEKHRVLGGECTGWDRYGYHIDGCIHWLVGTKEGTPMHLLWSRVGALDGVRIYHPESLLAFEHNGVTVHLYRDLDRLRATWMELSPPDKDAIETFCRDIRQLQSYEPPVGKPADMMTFLEKIRMFSSMKVAGEIMRKYGKISLTDYAKTFKHPALRALLASFLPDGYSASSVFFALAAFTKGGAGIPFGGSKAMAERMVQRYRSLGGKVEAPCEITDLIIDGRNVRKAIARDGNFFEADYFIAACDAKVLYERLLKGAYPDKAFEERYENAADYPLASQVFLALGYEGVIDGLPRRFSFPTEPFKVGSRSVHRIIITHYGHEPDFAPKGETLITCDINQFHDDYDAWDALYKDKEAYRRERARIGADVIRQLEFRFPVMRGRLKVLDVTTPKTYEHHCNAYRGAFMPFLPTIRGRGMAHTGRIKGLDNICLSGQWLQPPGGLPVALTTGRDTIMRLCHRLGRPFVDIHLEERPVNHEKTT